MNIQSFVQIFEAFGWKEMLHKSQASAVLCFQSAICVLIVVACVCGPEFWRVLAKVWMTFKPGFTGMWKTVDMIWKCSPAAKVVFMVAWYALLWLERFHFVSICSCSLAGQCQYFSPFPLLSKKNELCLECWWFQLGWYSKVSLGGRTGHPAKAKLKTKFIPI